MKFLKWALPLLLIASGCNTDPDINPPSSFNIYIFPNPAAANVNIALRLGSETHVEIFDSNGVSFYKQTVGSEGYISVSIADRSSGVFHVVATTSSETLTREFIKL